MAEAERLAVALERFGLDPGNGWQCPFSEAVAHISAGVAAQVPGPGLNSIWQLAGHIRVEAEAVLLRLKGLPVEYEALGAGDGWPAAGAPQDEEAWQEACRRTESAVRAAAAAVRGLSDAELAAPIATGWPSRGYWVQGLLAHTAYHTGQIVLLRRLSGLWEPLGWMPSADS
jgi:uncharacterized damage-inducible protein DinB